MSRFLAAVVPATLLLGACAVTFAQSLPSGPEKTTMNSSQRTISQFVPDTHAQVRQRNVTVDEEKAVLTRYERRDARNSGSEGEHFSTVVAADGTL